MQQMIMVAFAEGPLVSESELFRSDNLYFEIDIENRKDWDIGRLDAEHGTINNAAN